MAKASRRPVSDEVNKGAQRATGQFHPEGAAGNGRSTNRPNASCVPHHAQAPWSYLQLGLHLLLLPAQGTTLRKKHEFLHARRCS